MELILDIGSGKSLHNVHRAMEMIDRVKAVDSGKHKIVLKAQLFQNAPPNVPLDHDAFDAIYHYAKAIGYPMTASVFDNDSLAFLLRYKIPFVKIACRTDLYWLIGEVPRKFPVYTSVATYFEWPTGSNIALMCVRDYPASIDEYVRRFGDREMKYVSDHTSGWELYHRAEPRILEKHLCPEREPDNPDSGTFAVTPEELKEIM